MFPLLGFVVFGQNFQKYKKFCRYPYFLVKTDLGSALIPKTMTKSTQQQFKKKPLYLNINVL